MKILHLTNDVSVHEWLRPLAILACLLFVATAWACGQQAGEAEPEAAAEEVAEPASAPAAQDESPAEAIQVTRVDPAGICMSMDQEFGGEGPVVEIEGKSYRAFSPGCEENLRNDAAARVAVDPVSGNQVDKADAVIGVRPDGSVLYFESEETFRELAGEEPDDSTS